MSKMCERCDREFDGWRVTEARLQVGALERKPMLCPDCTLHVQEAVRRALRYVEESR